jgi:predicted esterase
MLIGFSQGGCLALEYAARNAGRYGGIVGLSAGLIGPKGTPRHYPGSMDGTPVSLGCDVRDFHIPETRVHETAAVFENMQADVRKNLYSNIGHTITSEEIFIVRTMMMNLLDLPG